MKIFLPFLEEEYFQPQFIISDTTTIFLISGCKVDLLLMMDSSGSICNGDFERMRILVNQTLDSPIFNIDNGDTHVALIMFSTDAQVIFNLSRYSRKTDVMKAVFDTSQEGKKTDLSAALNVARKTVFQPPGDRPNVVNVILMFTDGKHETDSEHPDPVQVAQSLRVDHLINIFCVSNTEEFSQVMKNISGSQGTSDPGVLGQDYFVSDSFHFDNQPLDSMSQTICQGVVLSPEQTNVPFGKFWL